MDKLDLIYNEVVHTRKELSDHVKAEDERFDHLEKDVSILKKDVALTQQRNGYINGFIAMMVAAVVSFFANLIGTRG